MPATITFRPAYTASTPPAITLNTAGVTGAPVTQVETEPSYHVKIVDKYGGVIRTMVNANVERIHEEIDSYGTDITWTFPKYDPAAAVGQGAAVALLKREAQVFQNGAGPIAWGVLVGARADAKDGAVEVTTPGLGWYWSRRYLDKARDNYLPNPGFESGLTGWTANACTATVVTSPRRLDAQAVRLVSSTTDADAYLWTTFDITGTEVGTNVYVAVHSLIESFTGPALQTRGLYVEAGPPGGAIVQPEVVNIDAATDQGVWNRLEIEPIRVPVSTTWRIQVRLYAPNGSVVYDAGQAVIPESVGGGDGVDITALFKVIVEHAQAPTAGKSHLNIATSTPASGVTIPGRAWQFDEHTPAESAIRELSDRDDGFDHRIEFSATDRTATTYHPRIGVNRSATTTLTLGVNVADYDLGQDGATTENNVTVMADGDGPDREEGYAVDTAALDGLVLQGVHPAPPGTTIDALEPLASGHLATKKRLVRHLTVTTFPSIALVQLLKIGDIVAVVIDDGWVQVTGNWRIVDREHTPRNETLRLTLNEFV